MPEDGLQPTSPPNGATPALNAALAKAKLAFDQITASRRVDIPTSRGKISFTYAEAETIAAAVTPALSENELTIAHQLTLVGNGLAVRTTLRHSSGEQIDSYYPLPAEKISEKTGETDQKSRGAAISYARRYNVMCLLDINSTNSDEWDETKRKLAQDLKHEMRQVPSTPTQNKRSPAPRPNENRSLVNRPMISQEINRLMEEAGMSVAQAKKECSALFGVESRESLDSEQLVQLRNRFANIAAESKKEAG